MNKLFGSLHIMDRLKSMASILNKTTEEVSKESEIKVTIETGSIGNIEIDIPSEQLEFLSTRWLLQETIRKFKQGCKEQEFNEKRLEILALKTKNKEYAVDCLLNDPKRSLAFLKVGTVLEPHYGDSSALKKEIRSKVGLKDFIIEAKLGCGSYSNVYLVRRKATGKLYALKQITKETMSQRKREMLEIERNSLLELRSPFIIPLRWVFQTTHYCYFVLDFVPCGDLHKVLSTKARFSEEETKFFIAEVILGLNEIHSNNLIYRDLKPENLLVDLDGHIQITDFGLAQRVSSIRDPIYSKCGTLEIIAPEVVKGTGYNCLADYYNIGTLAFELVTGKVPNFNDKEHSFSDIAVLEELKVSPGLQDFICRLLEVNPANRLGAKKGLNEICAHQWLKDVNMVAFSKKQIKSPMQLDPYSIKYKTISVHFDIDEEYDYEQFFIENAQSEYYLQRTLQKFSFSDPKENFESVSTFDEDPIEKFNGLSMQEKEKVFAPKIESPKKFETAQEISLVDKQIEIRQLRIKKAKTARETPNAEGMLGTDEVSDSSELMKDKLKKYTKVGGTVDNNEENFPKWCAHFKGTSQQKAWDI